MSYVGFLQLLSSSYSYPGMWLNTLPWYLSRLFYFVITLIFSALNGFCFSSIFLSVLLYRVWFSLQVIYAVCEVLSLLGAKTLFHYFVILLFDFALCFLYYHLYHLLLICLLWLSLLITLFNPTIVVFSGYILDYLGSLLMPWHLCDFESSN